MSKTRKKDMSNKLDKETLKYLRESNIEYRWDELEERLWDRVGLRIYDTDSATDEQLELLDQLLCDIEGVIIGTLTSYESN